MAASNKPTALHFSLIFFVMATIILGVMAFMFSRDYNENVAKWEKTDADLRTANSAIAKQVNDINRLKELIGHPVENVGADSDQPGPDTVIGRMRDDMQKYGGALAQPTFSATITKLRQELDAVTAARDAVQASLAAEHQQLQALQGQYQAMVDQHQAARTGKEGELQKEISQREESEQAKEQIIAQLRDDAIKIQSELDREIEAHQNDSKRLSGQLSQLTLINQSLREKLDQATQVSFEVPDGKLVRVDSATRLVWVDLGSADNLPLRTTFSVYGKTNHGVGRGPEDIKGQIEITRILSDNLSEGRMIGREEIGRPMTPGDAIYTPLWSPGTVEGFAFAGKIDFDGDGISDRETLHEIMKSAGAVVTAELDEDGNRTGGTIDVDTKFLVLGDIKEPTTNATPEQRQKYEQMVEKLKEMRTEADQHGVRKVDLDDFLSYIGYHSKRRLYLPGSNRPYTLRSGSRTTATNEEFGNTAGAYSGDRKLPQKESTGQTSGSSFRGNR